MEQRRKCNFSVVCKYFILFLAISFLGWLWETIYVSILANKLVDRGFLFLPLCPIYGCTVMSIYLLLGTPQEARGLLKNIKNKPLRITLYIIFCFILPSLLELIVGLFFEKVFGVVLWTYADKPFNILGYICLQNAIIWGICLTFIMFCVYPWFEKIVLRVSDKPARIITIVTIILIIIDFIASALYHI